MVNPDDEFKAEPTPRGTPSLALVQVQTRDGPMVGLYANGGLYHQGRMVSFQMIADAADFELIELPVDPQCLLPGNKLPQELSDVRIACR